MNEYKHGPTNPKDVGLTWAYFTRNNPSERKLLASTNKGSKSLHPLRMSLSIGLGILLGTVLYPHVGPFVQSQIDEIIARDNEVVRQTDQMYKILDYGNSSVDKPVSTSDLEEFAGSGYEISYPKNWKRSQNTFFQPQEVDPSARTLPTVTVTKGALEYSSLAQQIRKGYTDFLRIPYTQEETQLSDRKTVLVKYEQPGRTEGTKDYIELYFIQVGDGVFLLTAGFGSDTEPQQINQVRKVVHSFKLILPD